MREFVGLITDVAPTNHRRASRVEIRDVVVQPRHRCWMEDQLLGSPELCGVCGVVISNGVAGLRILLPDSSVVDPTDPTMDGRRRAVACCTEHLDALRSDYADRPFVDEELWAAKVECALRATENGELGRTQLMMATGLTIDQIRKAIAWRNQCLRTVRGHRKADSR
jgi:hypothetical protein